MFMTISGKVILVEAKGNHLKNDDSWDKIDLRRVWRKSAGICIVTIWFSKIEVICSAVQLI